LALEAQPKRQVKGKAPAIAKVSEEVDGKGLRFRVGGFAALRKKLGLSAAEMAKLLGVSAQSVYHWETGKSKPRASQLQEIAAVR
jgi:DNA-binding transcriptional regulator YiaG